MARQALTLLLSYYRNPLRKWYWKNLRAILSNIAYRTLFLILDGVGALALLIAMFFLFSQTKELIAQIILLGFMGIFLYLPVKYALQSLDQISSELSLNISIHEVRREINLKKRDKERDFHPLQVRINSARSDLKYFIDVSEVLAPPVYDYELDRLQKGIDVFFNSTSEVLFPVKNLFSRAQRIEQQQTMDYYRSLEHPTEEEVEEQYEEMQKAEMGEIDWFDLDALDEFMQYLGEGLFIRTKAYSPFTFKHPINVIMLSRFFDYWNSVVSSCRNCRDISVKVNKDVEAYYKSISRSEMLRRQRRWRLMDDAIIVILSVALSTILNYLLLLAKLLPQT